MNNVTIEGNLTRDPELRFTPAGLAICSFGVADNRRWQVDGEWKEATSFFDVTAFKQLGENIGESLSKGDAVIVVGRLEQDTWEDKETHENRSKVKVIAANVGPGLRWATAETTRNPKRDGFGPSDADFERDAARLGGGSPAAGGAGDRPPDSVYDDEPF